jgi:hypothetical protein
MLIFVKNFPDRVLAELAQQELDEQEIESMLKGAGGDSVNMGGTAGPVGFLSPGFDLYVDEEDAPRAMKLLRELYEHM